MIEQPPSLSDQHPLHLIDTLVYTGQRFNVWENAQAFSQAGFQGINPTEKLEQSVGCLLFEAGNSFELLATAFVVRHLPPQSNLFIDNSQGRLPVKALLLTAAHVYSSPLSCKNLPENIFFTLSPSLDDATLNTYSKFRVRRLLAFDPSTEGVQIDPLLDYQYLMWQDVELLAIIEGDLTHQLAANGNDFHSLNYRNLTSLDQHGARQACVIVGYPGRLSNHHTQLWAPIVGKDERLRAPAEDVGSQQLKDPMRAFSRGQIIRANDTCVAVNCSTWQGMSGSPICILSQDGSTLDYCGVYNGSAAMPFQALISKILFRFQGKGFQFTADDVPGIPDYYTGQLEYQSLESRPRIHVRSKLLWVKILRKLIVVLSDEYKTLEGLTMYLNNPLREFLSIAESIGINVEHNLGVCGGDRFSNIIRSVERSKTLNTNAANFLQFEGLTRLNALLPAPLTMNQKNQNLQAFLNQFSNGKSKKYLIFSDNAEQLTSELKSKLTKFIAMVENHITTIDERIVNKKFEKIRKRFRKIFEIWRTAL